MTTGHLDIDDIISQIDTLEPVTLQQSIAQDNAISELKYRRPEEPLEIRAGRYVKFVGQCPNCGRLVDSDGNYCKRCGKALDWNSQNAPN